MYIKGQLKWGEAIDTSDEGDYSDITGAYLPHSCEKWVIGDAERIRWLIEDLQALLKQAEEGNV